MTDVTVGAGGTRVTIRGGQSQRVTLRKDTVAKINDARPRVIHDLRSTPVNVVDRPTNVQTGGGMGVQGPPGTGDKNYLHLQALPAATWVVQHNLNKYPSVSIVDSGGEVVEGDIVHDSLNQCTLTFAGAFSGKATCN